MKLQKQLISQIKDIVSNAQQRAVRSVNTERVAMYWQIGKVIFEEEQQGKERATYGTFLIKSISQELQPQLGSGFSVRQLERYRQLYRMFPIASAVRTQLGKCGKIVYSVLIDEQKNHCQTEAGVLEILS